MPKKKKKKSEPRPRKKKSKASSPPKSGSQVVGYSEGGPVGRVMRYLSRYIALPELLLLVIATWIVAAWLFSVWDRFGILLITSPEKRCGKTRLLQCIEQVVPNAKNLANLSPAVVYRLLAEGLVTLLIDEAQSISRRGSEDSALLREILCGSIDRDATVARCVGDNHDPVEMSIASPKAAAHIGKPNSVLADRSLIISIERRPKSTKLDRVRTPVLKEQGAEISAEIEEWAAQHEDAVGETYNGLDLSDEIDNDRLAEILLPLQAILTHAWPEKLPELLKYAADVERAEAMSCDESHGVLLLRALREIFVTPDKKKGSFFPTKVLIDRLLERDEELWGSINRGRDINAEKLASLLREFGIRSDRRQIKLPTGHVRTTRGYCQKSFEEAWARYLPLPPE